MSAPVSSAARAGSDRRHCRPLPVRKPLGPAGTPNRDMFGPRPALFGFRPSEVGRQKRCGQRRERQKKKSCGHTLPGRRCDTEPSDSRHGKNAGSQYALFASRTVSSEAVQSPTVRRAVVAPASSRRKSPQILRRKLRRKRTGPLRSPNAGPNTSRAHHGTGTDEGRRQRNNDRDTAVKRQGSGETAERRQRNDRTAAEKQRSGDRETTGQQRRNSRDTAGKRQDSGAETAGTRRGNDRTAAQKQRNGGRETTGRRRKNSRDTAGQRQDSSGETAERRRNGGRTHRRKKRGPFDSGPLSRRCPAEGDRPHPRSRGAAGRQFTKVSPSLSASMRIGFSRFTSPARIRFERSLTMYRWIVRFTGRAP